MRNTYLKSTFTKKINTYTKRRKTKIKKNIKKKKKYKKLIISKITYNQLNKHWLNRSNVRRQRIFMTSLYRRKILPFGLKSRRRKTRKFRRWQLLNTDNNNFLLPKKINDNNSVWKLFSVLKFNTLLGFFNNYLSQFNSFNWLYYSILNSIYFKSFNLHYLLILKNKTIINKYLIKLINYSGDKYIRQSTVYIKSKFYSREKINFIRNSRFYKKKRQLRFPSRRYRRYRSRIAKLLKFRRLLKRRYRYKIRYWYGRVKSLYFRRNWWYRLFLFQKRHRQGNRKRRRAMMRKPFINPRKRTRMYNLSNKSLYTPSLQVKDPTLSNKYFLKYLRKSFILDMTSFVGLPFIKYNYDLKRANIDKLEVISRNLWLREDVKFQFLKHFLVVVSKNKIKSPLHLKKIKKKWKKKKFLKFKRGFFSLFYSKFKSTNLTKLQSYYNLPQAMRMLFLQERLTPSNVLSYTQNFNFKLKQRYALKFYQLKKWKKFKFNNHLRLYRLNYKYAAAVRRLIFKKSRLHTYIYKKNKWKSLRTTQFHKWNFKKKFVHKKTKISNKPYYRYNLLLKKFFNYEAFTGVPTFVTPLVKTRRTARLRKKIATHMPYLNRIWAPKYFKRPNLKAYKWYSSIQSQGFNLDQLSRLIFVKFIWVYKRFGFFKAVPRRRNLLYWYSYRNKLGKYQSTPRKSRLYRSLRLLRRNLIFGIKNNYLKSSLFYKPKQFINNTTFTQDNFVRKSSKLGKFKFQINKNLKVWITDRLNIKLKPRNRLNKYLNLNVSSFLIYKIFKLYRLSSKYKLVRWHIIYDFVYSNDLRKKLFYRKKRMFMFNLVHKRFKKFKKSIFFKKWFPIKRYKIKILQNLYMTYLNENYYNSNNLFSTLFKSNTYKTTSHNNFFAYQKMHNLHYSNEYYTKNKYSTYDVWREMYLKRIRFKPGYQRLWRRARIGIKEFMGWKYIYQKQLTKQLAKFKQTTLSTRLWLKNTTFKQMVMYSRLLPSEDAFDLFFKQKQLFLNGLVAVNDSVTCFRHDFIQILISYSYYVYYKWLKNWTQIRSSKFRHLVYRKGKAYKYRVIKQRKQKSYYVPKWIYIVKYDFIDIKSYLEVDYFTLSAFVVYSPYIYYFHYFEHFDYLRTRILRLYNWKYLT